MAGTHDFGASLIPWCVAPTASTLRLVAWMFSDPVPPSYHRPAGAYFVAYLGGKRFETTVEQIAAESGSFRSR
jgi:hypothetical protein